MPYRTDLAAESAQALEDRRLPGLKRRSERCGQLEIDTVNITDDETARLTGKPPGEYITFSAPPFYTGKEITEEEICAIAGRIAAMLPQEGLVLVAGLGNNDITPDAIGPRTARQVLATRHISSELKAQAGLENLRAVAVLAPGVLGQTGIETSEIIHAVTQDIKPCAVIAVDALAARSASRLGCTVQVANTGISPGSGVMNHRKELSTQTLGVPVVSIGVPTVVDAATLAGDLLSGDSESEEIRALFEPQGQKMMITPREIDNLISHACKILSLSINKALQPDLTLEEIGQLV